jgi:hypothetical protein
MTVVTANKTCINCHAEAPKLTKQLCSSCYRYQQRHGGARPLPKAKMEEQTDIPPSATKVNGPACFVCQAAKALPEHNGHCTGCWEQLREETMQTSTKKEATNATKVPVALATDPYAQAVTIILELARNGPEGIVAALKSGRLRVDGMALKTAAPRRGKLDLDKARSIRARLAGGEKTDILAIEYGVHTSTILDIKANRIWKEVVA